MACLTFHSGWWRDWKGYAWRRLDDASGNKFQLGAAATTRSYPNLTYLNAVHCRQKIVDGEWVDDQDYIVFAGWGGQLVIRRNGVWESHDLYGVLGYEPRFTGVYVIDTDDLILVGYRVGHSVGSIWRWKGGTNLTLLHAGIGTSVNNSKKNPQIHGYAGGYDDHKQIIVATFANAIRYFSRCEITIHPFAPVVRDIDNWGDWQTFAEPLPEFKIHTTWYNWDYVRDVRVAARGRLGGTYEDHPAYGIWVAGHGNRMGRTGEPDYIVAQWNPGPANGWSSHPAPYAIASSGCRLITTPDPYTLWLKYHRNPGGSFVTRQDIDARGLVTFVEKRSCQGGETGDCSIAPNRLGFSTDPPRYVAALSERIGLVGCSNCARLFVSEDFGENYTEIEQWSSPVQSQYDGAMVQFEIPLVSSQSPAPASVGNPGRPTIQADIVDEDAITVVANTVTVKVDSGTGWVTAWANGAASSGWTGTLTAIAGGYRIAVTPTISLPKLTTIRVLVSAYNDIGNHTLEDESQSYPGMVPAVSGYVPGSGYWEFETAAYPIITPVDPLNLASSVSPHSTVQFTLIGDENIALPWSVSIDRGAGFELAFTYDGTAWFEPQFHGQNSALIVNSTKSYDLTIHPLIPFSYGRLVIIQVTAEDISGQLAVVV